MAVSCGVGQGPRFLEAAARLLAHHPNGRCTGHFPAMGEPTELSYNPFGSRRGLEDHATPHHPQTPT